MTDQEELEDAVEADDLSVAADQDDDLGEDVDSELEEIAEGADAEPAQAGAVEDEPTGTGG
jgi:hypothetical protein